MQQPPGRHWIDFQHRRMNGIDLRRNGHQIARSHRNSFAPGTEIMRKNNERPGRDFGGVPAGIDNYSCAFESRCRREFRSHRIFAFDLVQVRGIDWRGAHLH